MRKVDEINGIGQIATCNYSQLRIDCAPMKTETIATAAKKLGVSHWRVRQIYKQMAISPIGYYRNSPLFSPAQVRQMAARNTKPGPKGNGQ